MRGNIASMGKDGRPGSDKGAVAEAMDLGVVTGFGMVDGHVS